MTDFHVARFGNKSSAHDVLGHSGIPQDVLTSLVWRTDAPPDSAGLDLEPFVAAYRSGDFYVVQATDTDVDAPRAGMVTTTAALVPMADVATLDICALWGALAGGVAVDKPLDRAEFLLAPVSETHVHAPGAKAAASALLTGGRVVWTGPGLEQFVGCWWLHLRPQNRGRFVVAAAGHPERISVPSDDESLTVVKSGVKALGRWSEWTAASETSVGATDAVRDAMFGDDAGRAEQLAERLGLGEVQFAIWRHLANAANLFGKLSGLTHGQSRALLQLLGLVQPDPGAGVEVMDEVLGRLSDLTPSATFADMRGLRGIPWDTLRDGARRELLDAWAGVVVRDAARGDDVLQAASEVAETGPSNEFMTELGAAVAAQLRTGDVERLVVAGLASDLGPAFLAWFADLRTAATADEVVAAAVANGAAVAPWLIESAQTLRLPVTHASSVPIVDPVGAWSAQIGVRPRSLKAEDVLAERTGAAGVVAAALALTDKKLLDRASKAAASDGSLLRGGSVEEKRFRVLWFAAIRAGADPWGTVRPADAVGPLLNLLLAGEDVEPGVLMSLSLTTSADISSYGSRSDVWAKFPAEALKGFRDATAQSVARSFRRGDDPLEQPLAGAVMAAPLLEAVARESAAQALELLGGVPSAGASDAVVVVTFGRFDPAEEVTLGSLVKHRNWRRAAEVIVELSASRADLRSAAEAVSGMFTFLDRISRFFSVDSPVRPLVSGGELQSGLTDVASRLYPSGPTHDGVWERSGGDEADLVVGSTGRLAWGRAIEGSLSGRRGAPPVAAVLTRMLEDFPSNPQLLALKKTIENGPLR